MRDSDIMAAQASKKDEILTLVGETGMPHPGPPALRGVSRARLGQSGASGGLERLVRMPRARPGAAARTASPAETVSDLFKRRDKTGLDAAVKAAGEYRRERRRAPDATPPRPESPAA